ncbi:molybdopterin-dependent oxidoreductase [Nocardioides sp. MAH-18]|uniref:Molybdopterin-dependent oxidoreductase n=1 Tax=Nocardioides agri TaxID=2682843 RepID=A0A6L6XQL5_9ACTN|nr:molybdopterin-dependent oxidoreductase [Nocardioides sp. CGMCC 1.13656]MBA2953025.1 molybdopterin-dependent oxidoreductase [Nocardioides sp. CGMCC 1.13656]MVQ47895.1 molybdopterin-dependent oxidoreductase [Nocardioides sp. MAH-18]
MPGRPERPRSAELDGTPVGRRVVLGLLGLGAVGVVTGSTVQQGLSRALAPVQMRDPTGLSQYIPIGNTFRYYSVAGAIDSVDAASYSLAVSGLVATPTTYTLADLRSLPQAAITEDFHCVTGWRVEDVPWTGVRLAHLLDLASPSPEAVAIRFRSFDGVYTENMTLEQARDDVLVALTMYGEPVTHYHGGPVRIYAAPMYGYKSTKWLSEIELTDRTIPGYWEDRGYPLDGIIGE